MTFYIEKVKGQCDIQNVIQHHSWIGTNLCHSCYKSTTEETLGQLVLADVFQPSV